MKSESAGPSGLQTIARQETELEELFEKIPPEQRGVLFERVLETFHPQENTRRLELAFAAEWASRNDPRRCSPLLERLLDTDESDPRKGFVPMTEREWQVAHLIAATVIQWLPTSGGCAFLHDAFRRGGGKFEYHLPETP